MKASTFVDPTASPHPERSVPNVQIALVNVASDANRGACALTSASLYLLVQRFPSAHRLPLCRPPRARHLQILPRSGTQRTVTQTSSILPPLFDGQGKATLALIWRLARSLGEILRFDRKRRNRNATLEWIRNSDLVVSVGGVTFETYGGTLRHDARFVTRVLPLLAAQKIDVPTVFVGAQIGPFNTRLGGRLFGWLAAKAAMVFPRDHVSESEVRRQVADPRCILMPDSAFALKLPAVSTDRPVRKARARRRRCDARSGDFKRTAPGRVRRRSCSAHRSHRDATRRERPGHSNRRRRPA